jgi:hypothetical protein
VPRKMPDHVTGGRYVPGLLSRIASGGADPTTVLTQQESMPTVLEASEGFDRRGAGLDQGHPRTQWLRPRAGTHAGAHLIGWAPAF